MSIPKLTNVFKIVEANGSFNQDVSWQDPRVKAMKDWLEKKTGMSIDHFDEESATPVILKNGKLAVGGWDLNQENVINATWDGTRLVDKNGNEWIPPEAQ